MTNPPGALFRLFEAVPRQGPGDDAITRSLFERYGIPGGRVLDLGCGTGAAALTLARAGAKVTGVDIHQPFLDALAAKANAEGLGARVDTRCADMLKTGFRDGAFDAVWSEGAVYAVGFDAALTECRRLVRPGGAITVSECVWFHPDPPEDVRAHWAAAYPGMRTPGATLDAATDLGLHFLHAEKVPFRVWERGFYAPLEAAMAQFTGDDDPEMQAVIAEQRAEIALHRKWPDVFGYVHFVWDKP